MIWLPALCPLKLVSTSCLEPHLQPAITSAATNIQFVSATAPSTQNLTINKHINSFLNNSSLPFHFVPHHFLPKYCDDAVLHMTTEGNSLTTKLKSLKQLSQRGKVNYASGCIKCNNYCCQNQSSKTFFFTTLKILGNNLYKNSCYIFTPAAAVLMLSCGSNKCLPKTDQASLLIINPTAGCQSTLNMRIICLTSLYTVIHEWIKRNTGMYDSAKSTTKSGIWMRDNICPMHNHALTAHLCYC